MKFKRENGKTRLKSWVEKAKAAGEKIPQVVIDLVSVPFPRVGKVIEAIKHVSEDSELSPMVRTELLDHLQSLNDELEAITERHAADMSSDSWMSKNIRPIVLAALLVNMLVTHYLSGNGYMLWTPEQIAFQGSMTLVAIEFYFGGRAAMLLAQAIKK